MKTMLLLSATAGILGTGIGGILGLFFAEGTKRMLHCMMAFAAGIMISIVSFELMPEAMALGGVAHGALGMVLGIVAMLAMSCTVEWVIRRGWGKQTALRRVQELNRRGKALNASSKALYKSGIIMLIAISVHNLPEGIAIGSGGAHELKLGVGIAFAIALHDVPEGMAISAPLVAGGMRRWHVVILTALSGLSTIIGAAAGFALGGVSSTVTSYSISSAAGAMLYVVFGEVFPETVNDAEDKSASIAAIIGFMLGMLFIEF